MKAYSKRLAQNLFDIATRAWEFSEKEYYKNYGCKDASCKDANEDFQRHLGLSPRMRGKYFTIPKAISGLPEQDQDDAKRQIRAVGVTRASIIAPLLRRDPDHWRETVGMAEQLPSEELQQKISSILEPKRRGQSARPVRTNRSPLGSRLREHSHAITTWLHQYVSPTRRERTLLERLQRTVKNYLAKRARKASGVRT
jgi:hypothetical protein